MEYKRQALGEKYYYISDTGVVFSCLETNSFDDDLRYKIGNYYSNKAVAVDTARADILLKQLRKFAFEHREIELNWEDINQQKFHLSYDYEDKCLRIVDTRTFKNFCQIYLDSIKTAQLAMNTFKDELLWYFTEYQKSSL